MNSSLHGLIKNLALLALLLFTAFVFMYDRLEDWAIGVIGVALGGLYLVFSITESIAAKKSSKGTIYTYLTNGTIAKKAIRIFSFLMAALILYFVDFRLQNTAMMLFILVAAESIVFVYRVSTKGYFLLLEPKSITIYANKELRLFASQVTSVEYRHNIFHLTHSDKKLFKIELEKLKPEHKEEFIQRFIAWCTENNLEFTQEAKEKLRL
jgi:hypothetical protein